jgi:hypothetical protein
MCTRPKRATHRVAPRDRSRTAGEISRREPGTTGRSTPRPSDDPRDEDKISCTYLIAASSGSVRVPRDRLWVRHPVDDRNRVRSAVSTDDCERGSVRIGVGSFPDLSLDRTRRPSTRGSPFTDAERVSVLPGNVLELLYACTTTYDYYFPLLRGVHTRLDRNFHARFRCLAGPSDGRRAAGRPGVAAIPVTPSPETVLRPTIGRIDAGDRPICSAIDPRSGIRVPSVSIGRNAPEYCSKITLLTAPQAALRGQRDDRRRRTVTRKNIQAQP